MRVQADYLQFYARRAGAAFAGDQVDEDGYERRLWTDGSFVYLGTAGQHATPEVEVEVLDGAPPTEPPTAWDHVVETSLEAGGDLEVLDWDVGRPPAGIVPRPRGPLRLRVHWAGLGREDESLLFQLWPASAADTVVLRWWSGWLRPPPSDTSPDGRRQVQGNDAVHDRTTELEQVAWLRYPYPRMPGGGEHSSVTRVYTDRSEGSWWALGTDDRFTLREVTAAEAEELLANPRHED